MHTRTTNNPDPSATARGIVKAFAMPVTMINQRWHKRFLARELISYGAEPCAE